MASNPDTFWTLGEQFGSECSLISRTSGHFTRNCINFPQKVRIENPLPPIKFSKSPLNHYVESQKWLTMAGTESTMTVISVSSAFRESSGPYRENNDSTQSVRKVAESR